MAGSVTTMSGGGNGPDTIYAGYGVGINDSVYASSTQQLDANAEFIVLGPGSNAVTMGGSGTVFDGLGSTTINSVGPLFKPGSFTPRRSLIVNQTGQLTFSNAQPDTTNSPRSFTTVLGGSGSITVNGAVPAIYTTATGEKTYLTPQENPDGAGILLYYGNVYVGGSAGNNQIEGGTVGDELFGGGDGDVLTALYAGYTMIVAGSGAETLRAINDPAGAYPPLGNAFFGGPGQDLILGGGGGNTVLAGSGAITILSGSGNNTVGLGSGPALVALEGPRDTLFGASGSATVSAVHGALVVGGTGGMLFAGGDGSATVLGGAGSLTVFGGTASGLYAGGTKGGNQLVAGSAAATLFGGGEGDILYAQGAAAQVLAAGSGGEILDGRGGGGNNLFFAGSGNDCVLGGAGNDTLVAGTGRATLAAGSGADLFAFFQGQSGGADTISGFDSTRDKIMLNGYGAAAVANAISSATATGQDVSFTLPDGTSVKVLGLSSLTPSLFA